MNDKKRILIVDDHPFFREGLKSLLAQHAAFEVVGEAGEGDEALKKAEDLKPDLVIMDISLPDMNGIEVTRNIRESLPDTKVVMVSMHHKIDYITKAFEAGATGYFTKETATEKLVECIKTVVKGDYYVDSSLSHEVVKSLLKSSEQELERADAEYGALTPREQEILRLIAEGLSTKEIANNLFISPKTVENHRTNIMSKLDLHSTMELVRYAAKYGIIDIDLWKR